jgi:hypothetical protein
MFDFLLRSVVDAKREASRNAARLNEGRGRRSGNVEDDGAIAASRALAATRKAPGIDSPVTAG